MIKLVPNGGIKWYHTKTINKKRIEKIKNKQTSFKKMLPIIFLICLEYCFHLEHMVHLDSVLFGGNYGVMLKEGEYNTLGLIL